MKCQTCGKQYEPIEWEEDTHKYLKWRSNLYGYCSWACQSRDEPEDNKIIEEIKQREEIEIKRVKANRKLKRNDPNRDVPQGWNF